MVNLRGRSFLRELDFTVEELKYLLNLSHSLKAQKYNGVVDHPLRGKNIVILFQKDSTRTRCAFEVAAHDLGMGVTYIGPSGSQFGKKESTEDTAKVLGRMYDGIEFRGYKQEDVEILAKHSGVPVWNGLTDQWHPTQMIADFMTIQEQKGMDLTGKKFVYMGDARNNVANSLMIMAAKMGMHFVACAPKSLQPEAWIIKEAEKIAKETFAKIEVTADWKAASKDADVFYTDVWVSMGEPDSAWEARLGDLADYQVNMDKLKLAKRDVTFLHCLPAFHDSETEIGKEKGKIFGKKYPNVASGAFEVSDEVFRSKHSKVFDQAENRMHSIKAIMLSTLL